MPQSAFKKANRLATVKTMSIRLPDLINEKLSKNTDLYAGVLATVSDFDQWLSDSKVPFFADYTDHGIPHVTCVLETAVALMTDDAKAVLTPADAAVLTVAVLLHDSALHLSEAAFWELIKGAASNRRVEEFDSKPWNALWVEFMFGARRWGQSKLKGVFGMRPISVRDPFDDYTNLADSDRKLIGEFIRLHHPRIAHEFAVFGVPFSSCNPIRIDGRIETELSDVGGLVARSHGLPIRACLDYLSTKYHRREYRGVHAIYLMTLLRVADYLQIQSDRAPAVAFRYRKILSEVSQLEWEAHNSVKNITQTHDDPESIEIQARPQNTRTFLRLKQWLSGLQYEIDASWAVLGEVYGAHSLLSKLGLVIRRVRSNLDDADEFSKTVTYVPRRVRLDVARAELLKVLIRPLYGNNPSFGVRELVQNAVDAVREVEHVQNSTTESLTFPKIDQQFDVEVWLTDLNDSGTAALIVSDRGVGMDEEILTNYFLRVGSSYRSSQDWQKVFEEDIAASDGPRIRSQVVRSGRFGVGVLAAFLLGEKISVTTRHVHASRGVQFETDVESDAIELTYHDDIPVGTVVKIEVSRSTWSYLLEYPRSWDWYAGSSPSVIRKVGSGRHSLSARRWIPDEQKKTPFDWRRVEAKDYSCIFWTNVPERSELYCNGLKIGALENSSFNEKNLSTLLHTAFLHIRTPNVAVVDPDANLPLNLERTRLAAERLPFEKELCEDVIRDFFAFLLLHLPDYRDLEALSRLYYPGISADLAFWLGLLPFIVTERGVSVLEDYCLGQLGVERVFVLGLKPGQTFLDLPFDLGQSDALLLNQPSRWASGIDSIDTLTSGDTMSLTLGSRVRVVGMRLLRAGGSATFRSSTASEAHYDSLDGPQVEWADNRWIVQTVGDCGISAIDLNKVRMLEEANLTVMECFVDVPGQPEVRNVVERVWSEVINSPLIPFNSEDRRRHLASAFRTLAPYISSLEEECGAKAKEDLILHDEDIIRKLGIREFDVK